MKWGQEAKFSIFPYDPPKQGGWLVKQEVDFIFRVTCWRTEATAKFPVSVETCARTINEAFSAILGQKVNYAVVDSHSGDKLYSSVHVLQPGRDQLRLLLRQTR